MNKLIIIFLTILRKETARFMRVWSQTLLPPVITTTLYFAIFGHVLGPKLGLIQGVNYMQYIAPGLIMMAIINNAYMNTVASVYIMRFTKSIEEILVAPVPNYIILLGFTAAGITRGIFVGALVTVVALFFSSLHIHSILITVSIIILSALLFSLAGFLNALFARNFDDTAFIPSFILTPLNYLGGIFYPITLLPPFWHSISLWNPILYMVNAFRYGIIGISDIKITVAFAILISCSAVLIGLNLYFLNKGTGLRT
jgi:ABC-2 type transport system permease protein